MRNLIACLMILAIAGTASAAITVSAGNHNIGGGATGQTFEILITTDNADQVAGLLLWVQIGATATSVPDITDVAVDSVGIFNGLGTETSTDYTGSGFPGLYKVDLVVSSTDPNLDPIANGILASVTVDTTGFMTGTYAVKLMGTIGGSSNMIGDNLPTVTFNDGSITVPEPATLALLGLGSLGALIRRRRR